jgi:hypothetical protein
MTDGNERTGGISEAIFAKKIGFAEQTNGRVSGHTSDMFYLFLPIWNGGRLFDMTLLTKDLNDRAIA